MRRASFELILTLLTAASLNLELTEESLNALLLPSQAICARLVNGAIGCYIASNSPMVGDYYSCATLLS